MNSLLSRMRISHQMYTLAGFTMISFVCVGAFLWVKLPGESGLPGVLFGILVFGVLLSSAVFCLAFIMGSFNNQRAEKVVNAMAAMAKGDLTRRSDVFGHDEFAWMSWEYTKARKGFIEVVKNILSSSSHLAAAAEELSTITMQGSQGISRQQGEIQQVATSMEEMSVTVAEVAKNAASAAIEAAEADKQAKNGSTVVKHTVSTINSLAEEVKRTADVIEKLKGDCISIGTVLDVIRGIAEQTNLLALNAAIEAARAGEQGRGFAVVADEVRTLASRTQQSTQEIQEMIERLQNGSNEAVAAMEKGRMKAADSVEQAAKAGAALEAITTVVDRIKSMNMQIAGAAEEQSATTEEVNRNIVSISDVAEESAIAAQKTASSSDDLARLAVELQEQVAKFTVQ